MEELQYLQHALGFFFGLLMCKARQHFFLVFQIWEFGLQPQQAGLPFFSSVMSCSELPSLTMASISFLLFIVW